MEKQDNTQKSTTQGNQNIPPQPKPVESPKPAIPVVPEEDQPPLDNTKPVAANKISPSTVPAMTPIPGMERQANTRRVLQQNTPPPPQVQDSITKVEINNQDLQVRKSTGPKIGAVIGTILVLFLLIFGGLVGFGVLVAYGRVSLPDEVLVKRIQQAVFQFPFLPKTPEIVLMNMLLAHENVASAHVDASLAIKSESINDIFGTQDFDLVISGDVDANDIDDPKMSVNVKLTNQLDADLVFLNEKMYARVNKVPQEIAGLLLGISGDEVSLNPLLSQWVWFDTSKLDTDARGVLEENYQEEDVDEEYVRFLERVFAEVWTKKVVMTEEEVKGDATLKLTVDLIGGDIDKINQIYREEVESTTIPEVLDTDEVMMSDVIKQLKLTVWVLKDEYYLRKATVYMKADNSAYVSKYNNPDFIGDIFEEETMDIAFSVALTDVGKSFVINKPESAVSTEEFVAELTQIFMQVYEQADVGEEYVPPVLGVIDDWVEVEGSLDN